MGKRTTSSKSVNRGRTQSTAQVGPDHSGKGRPPLELALLALGSLGILLTGYLTYSAWFGDHPAFCGEGSGCDVVQGSRWATFLGMPMALWGCLTYIVMVKLVWDDGLKPRRWPWLLFVTVSGFAISLYLTVISIVEIEATCPYCLVSFGIITTMMVLTLCQRPPNWATSLKEAGVIAVLIVGALHLHYSGIFDPAAGPEDPQLQALAIHLTETGAKFYGAYWCPRCQEQKALFGASAKRLPYVECSSGGRGSALTPPCAKNNIKNYPTWIIGDRRYTGLQTPRSLATASGFKWQDE